MFVFSISERWFLKCDPQAAAGAVAVVCGLRMVWAWWVASFLSLVVFSEGAA